MEAAVAIHDFLDYVVAGLVAHPDEVEIVHSQAAGAHLYSIRLHPEDTGRVIGRSGKNILAIRSLVAASAEKHGIRAQVEVAAD